MALRRIFTHCILLALASMSAEELRAQYGGGGYTYPPPTITTQPMSQTVSTGGSVTFMVSATGSPTYQWMMNGTTIFGATGSSFSITDVQSSDAGTYTVLVRNDGGAVASYGAVLTVVSAPLEQ